MNDYRQLASDVVAELKRQGADACDAFVALTSDFSTEVRLGRIEKLEQSISKGLGMRVFKGGAMAMTYTTDFADKSVKSLASQALDIVKVSNPDEFNGLAPRESLGVYDGKLMLFDESIASIPTDKKIDMAREAEEFGMKADKRVTNSNTAGWSDGTNQVTLATSDGFIGQYRTTNAGLYVGLIAEEGGVKQTDSWYSFQRYAKRLLTPKEVGLEAAKRVTSKLGARKVKSQTVPLVVDPTMAQRLIGQFFGAASGRAVYRKSSFLVGKLGETIASPLVSLIDDATLPDGPGCRPFDAEGVRSSRVPFIEKGVLKSYLCDSYSSRRLKMPLTGTTNRGYQGGPNIGASNLFLMAGDKDPKDIIKGVKSGLYLRTMSAQGFNPVTGDFSHGATGHWIENGEIAYPVQEITIAGNVITAFRNITAVGNDLKFRAGGVASPTLLISEITVGGA